MRWLCCLVLCVANAAWADTIPVRSGEHDTFTRLVFTLPSEATQWSFSTDGEAPELIIHSDNPKFDTSEVFVRIPRTRLLELQQKEAGVALELACDCETKSFAFGSQSVVVDILDPVKDSHGQPSVQDMVLTKDQRTAESQHVSASAKELLKEGYIGIDQFLERRGRSETLKAQLQTQLDRAVSQGVVAPTSVQAEEEKPQDIPASIRTDMVEYTPNPHQNLNLLAQTSLDGSMLSDMPSLQENVAGHCVSDRVAAFSLMAELSDPFAQIGDLRRSLMTEFDEVDAGVATDLAYQYLFLTFGAETQSVLRLVPETNETIALMSLAELMDGDPATAQGVFSQQESCSEWHHFWSLLSGGKDAMSEEDLNVILRGFNKLPAHLRTTLASPTVASLIDANQADIAEQVLDAVERVVQTPGADWALAKAKVDHSQDRVDSAIQGLFDTVEQASPTSPKALVELVDLHHESGLEPSSDLISLVTAFAVEHRKTEYGPSLRRASGLARALAGDFHEGFQELKEIRKRDGPAQASIVREELMAILVEDADEFDLVRATVLNDLGVISSPQLRTKLVHRLLNAGFLTLAERSFPMENPTLEPAVRLANAKLAIAKGRPRQALAELLGLEGKGAELLRRKAYEAAGDYYGAMSHSQGLNQEAELGRYAWLAGDWGAMAESKDPMIASLARSRLARIETKEPVKGVRPLSKHREILGDSEVTQNLARHLLAIHEIGDVSTF